MRQQNKMFRRRNNTLKNNKFGNTQKCGGATNKRENELCIAGVYRLVESRVIAVRVYRNTPRKHLLPLESVHS